MELILTVLLFSLLTTRQACDKGGFSYVITSSASCGVDPIYGVGLERTVAAVDLALNYINSHPHLLPAINLTYGPIFNSLECPITGGSLEEVLRPHNYGIFGSSCDESAKQDFFIGSPFNFTPMINFAPTSIAGLLKFSTGSNEQPTWFSIHPTSKTYTLAILNFLRQFDWQRLSIITEGAVFFEEVLQDMRMLAPLFNVTLFESNRLSSGDFDIPEYIRIVFVNMNMSSAFQVLCQASNAGYIYPSYIWITYAGDFVLSPASSLSCNSSQLKSIVDGMITIEPVPFVGGQIICNIFTNITSMLQNIKDMEDTFPLSYYAVDAVLVLAQAINATLTGSSSNSPEWSYCKNEGDKKMMSISRCIVKQKLLNMSIQGLTGVITFNERGEREQNEMGLFQYRNKGNQTSSVLIGRIRISTSTNRVAFEFADGENETTLFRGPAPSDSFPVKVIIGLPSPLIIVFYTLATAGNILTLICFLFNIILRKRKIVKINSPNLNYFIILGAFLLYSISYFALYFSPTLFNTYIRCYATEFMVSIGYVFCFAPLLLKKLRVFYIFHKPSTTKKVIKDWYLSLGTVVLVGIMLAILMVRFIPVFQFNPMLVEIAKQSSGVNEDGIETVNCNYRCYGSSPVKYLYAMRFMYTMVLQVAALILTIISRKVKIKVLNDSKEVAITIYISTMVILSVAVLTFAVDLYLTWDAIAFGFGILLATTVFLLLLFVPKMVHLYKNPRGEGILGCSDTSRYPIGSATIPAVNS